MFEVLQNFKTVILMQMVARAKKCLKTFVLARVAQKVFQMIVFITALDSVKLLSKSNFDEGILAKAI